MKNKTVFLINDYHLTIFSCVGNAVNFTDAFDCNKKEDCDRFHEQCLSYNETKNYILFDLSCEDYHVEPLPHVTGRDKNLLVKRKLKKYFSSDEYVHVEIIERLKKGRRDDIYAMSGISDTSSFVQAVDLIAENNIEIISSYTAPLFIKQLIKPIVHDKQVLVVSCNQVSNGQYIFRQTFLDKEHLYLSRKTPIRESRNNEFALQFRKEIERTWQYLNNKKALSNNEPLQVLLLAPKELEKTLSLEEDAAQCIYHYVDNNELFLQHNCDSASSKLEFQGLAAFFIGKKVKSFPHYKPKKLVYYHKHQRLNRFLFGSCVAAILMTIIFLSGNTQTYFDIQKEKESLQRQSLQADREMGKYSEGYNYSGPSPQKMKKLVDLQNNISVMESHPEYIFEIISHSLASFNDLAISSIKWNVVSVVLNNTVHHDGMSLEQGNVTAEDMGGNPMDIGKVINGVSQPPSSINVAVTIKGQVRSFNGNYRQAIDRIQSLTERLGEQKSVKKAIATQLPLDINPANRISRILAAEKSAIFTIDLTINEGML